MKRSRSLLATLNSAILVTALAVGVQAPIAAISPAIAASYTPWMDRDNPGGKGDYEDTVNLLKQHCRIKGTDKAILPGASNGYTNKAPFGCWCENSKTNGGKCQDIEIRYSW